MTPRDLAEKIVDLFKDEFPMPNYILPKIESLLSSALKEAILKDRKEAYAKDDGSTLTIEGICYAKELFRAWGEKGVDVETLYKIESRENGCLTIRTLKWDEAIKEAKASAYEQCAKMLESEASRYASYKQDTSMRIVIAEMKRLVELIRNLKEGLK